MSKDHKRKNGSSSYASQIPYAQRLQIRKAAEIKAQREDAVNTALKIACVSLNDTEGLGFVRLCRFATHLMELVDEYWEDPEVGEHHLNQRLESMGFQISEVGRMQAMEMPDGTYRKLGDVSGDN